MGEHTGIKWCDHTFSAWWGCVKVSPACANCYAERDSNRWGFEVWGTDAPRKISGDKYWNEHSVLVPEKLAAAHPEKITQLSPYAFHYPLYDAAGLKTMFEEVKSFPEAYLHHLWESFSWEYLSKLTREKILTKNTTYNLIARRFL